MQLLLQLARTFLTSDAVVVDIKEPELWLLETLWIIQVFTVDLELNFDTFDHQHLGFCSNGWLTNCFVFYDQVMGTKLPSTLIMMIIL